MKTAPTKKSRCCQLASLLLLASLLSQSSLPWLSFLLLLAGLPAVDDFRDVVGLPALIGIRHCCC